MIFSTARFVISNRSAILCEEYVGFELSSSKTFLSLSPNFMPNFIPNSFPNIIPNSLSTGNILLPICGFSSPLCFSRVASISPSINSMKGVDSPKPTSCCFLEYKSRRLSWVSGFGFKVGSGRGLFKRPFHSLFCVFDIEAKGSELVADKIGCCPVFLILGILADIH